MGLEEGAILCRRRSIFIIHIENSLHFKTQMCLQFLHPDLKACIGNQPMQECDRLQILHSDITNLHLNILKSRVTIGFYLYSVLLKPFEFILLLALKFVA